MEAKRWREEPVEQLSPTIGRRMLHTERRRLRGSRSRRARSCPARAPERADRDRDRGPVSLPRGDARSSLPRRRQVPLAADVPHEVEALEDSVVLDVFSPVREDWLRGDDAYLRGS